MEETQIKRVNHRYWENQEIGVNQYKYEIHLCLVNQMEKEIQHREVSRKDQKKPISVERTNKR